MALVGDGVDGLDLWLADLVRNGLAGLELQPASFWEKQAARLVDAQAPGLAARVRRLAAIPNASPRWPERLLGALGRLALLVEAFRRLDSLDPALQADVRGLIGWTLKEEEVLAHGDLVRDRWRVIGQWIEEEDRGRAQRTWLLGTRSGCGALVLQFSFAGAPFAPSAIPGTVVDATLAFWPSAYPQRALIHARHGAPMPLAGALHESAAGGHEAPQAPVGPTPDEEPPAQPSPPSTAPIAALLAGVADALARQPWLERFPCLLRDVVPVPAPAGEPWRIRDGDADALPLIPGDHWHLLALSGGHPLDLAAEWDGLALRPLGAVADGIYHTLWEAR